MPWPCGRVATLVSAGAAAPAPAAAGSLSLKISPSELSPLETATLSGRISPKLKKRGKLLVQISSDDKAYTTIRTLNLAKGAKKYTGTFTAGTLLGPIYLRTKLGTLSTKGIKVTITETVDVQIKDSAFSIKVLTVEPWTTVSWTNSDLVDHTVTSVDSLDLDAVPTELFDSGAIAGGQGFHFTFSTPGTFFYECQIHSSEAALHAEVIVQ
jgi:plastocyanin